MRRISPWIIVLVSVAMFCASPFALAEPPVKKWQIRGILRALKEDEAPKVRMNAMSKLLQLLEVHTRGGDPRVDWDRELYDLAQRACKDLRTFIEDPDIVNRRIAIKTVGYLGGKDDLPALRKLLKDPEDWVREAAAEAICRLAGKDDLPALHALLKDRNQGVISAAAEAIGRLGSKDDLPALRDLFEDHALWDKSPVAEAICRLTGKDDLSVLRALLKDRNPWFESAGAEAVGRLGNKDDLPALRVLLTDPWVMRAAGEAVGRLGGKDDLPALRTLLKISDARTQRAAAEAICRLTGKDDLPALHALLKDSDTWVKSAAVEAVGRLGNKDDLPALRDLLNDPDLSVQNAAAEAVGRLGSKDDLPALRHFFEKNYSYSQETAAETIGRLSTTPDLISDDILSAICIDHKGLAWRHQMRWFARYWGGRFPDESEVLCAYLWGQNSGLQPPVSHDERKSKKENALNDLHVLRIYAWERLNSNLADEEEVSRVKWEVAKWWSTIITEVDLDWQTDDEMNELKTIRDLLTDEKNKVGRPYIGGIEKVLERVESPYAPLLRTCATFLILNLLALLFYQFSSKLGGVGKWLPFVLPVVFGTGVDFAAWLKLAGSFQLVPWLLVGLLAIEFVALVVGGVVSPKVLRLIAPVKPLNLAIPLALRLPWSRRRFFRDYVDGLRNQMKRDRLAASAESYVPLPTDRRDNQRPEPVLCPEPATDILAFLSGLAGMAGHVVIEATGGKGKSALVREVVWRALDAFERNPTRQPLPVLLVGKGESLEKMMQDPLASVLLLPELLQQFLDAGDFFLVLDGIDGSGVPEGVLTAFVNGPCGRTTNLLLSGRPTGRYRAIIEGTAQWLTLAPRALDDGTLEVFTAHYGVTNLSAPLKAACRGRDGTYLPILVRMAMLVNQPAGPVANRADIYREYLLKLFEKTYPNEQERLKRIKETSRWCLETYWVDGRRPRDYTASELQSALKEAGVLVGVGGLDVPKEVRFFHDSMQSYLTAFALKEEDDAGYPHMPRPPKDKGNEVWNRQLVLYRAAGDPKFVESRSDTALPGGTELFQMFVALFNDRQELRQDLREDLEEWTRRQHKNLVFLDFQSALPPAVTNQTTSNSDNKTILMEAIAVAFAADAKADNAESLAILYGCLAPLIYKLRERDRKK